MKTFKIGSSAVLVLMVSFFIGCSDNDILNTKQTTPEKMGLSGEKYEALLALNLEEQISPRATISYIASFCSDVVWIDTHATKNSILYPEYWDFYSFYAYEGATIDIYVKRLTCGMDPAFRLFTGTYTDTDDLPASLGFWDDQIAHTCCYSDPYLDNWSVPSTGYYTVAVFDYASCESAPFAYELILSGLTLSANTTTIVLDCCDSGVDNYVFDDGDTMMGLIMECAEDAENHGEFVNCVSHLTNEWKKEGLITGYEKELIMSCVGEANIP